MKKKSQEKESIVNDFLKIKFDNQQLVAGEYLFLTTLYDAQIQKKQQVSMFWIFDTPAHPFEQYLETLLSSSLQQKKEK